jgi:hypothetical protein
MWGSASTHGAWGGARMVHGTRGAWHAWRMCRDALRLHAGGAGTALGRLTTFATARASRGL